jgi:hypothetical protein
MQGGQVEARQDIAGCDVGRAFFYQLFNEGFRKNNFQRRNVVRNFKQLIVTKRREDR